MSKNAVTDWIKKQMADAAGSPVDLFNLATNVPTNFVREAYAKVAGKEKPAPLPPLLTTGSSTKIREALGVGTEDSLGEQVATALLPLAGLGVSRFLTKLPLPKVAQVAQVRQVPAVPPEVTKRMQELGITELPYAYTLPPTDPARRGYELLVQSSQGKISDTDFITRMAQIQSEAGLISPAQATQLRRYNTKFGKDSWDYINEKLRAPDENPTLVSLASELPHNPVKGMKDSSPSKSVAGADFAAEARAMKRERERFYSEINSQANLAELVKFNINPLLEDVASAHATQAGLSPNRLERAAQFGFSDTPPVDGSLPFWMRADSAFNEAHPSARNYVGPADITNQVTTVPQEVLKGENARYHGQMFTKMREELNTYSSTNPYLPTSFSPVYIKDDALTAMLDVTNPAHREALLSSPLAGTETAERLSHLKAFDRQLWDIIEDPSLMHPAKDKGFRGFETDEPGPKGGNISVFNPSDVRSIGAIFDPFLTASPNRFAAAVASPIAPLLLEDDNNGK